MNLCARPAVLGLLTISALLLWQRDEVPRWTGAGSRMVLPQQPLAPVGKIPIVLPDMARIEFRGDSNLRQRGRFAGQPSFPQLAAAMLGDAASLKVISRGGGTIRTVATVQLSRHPPDLVVVMFGSNDAASRRWLGHRQPVPLVEYRTRLAQEIGRHRSAGSAVLVLAPLGAGSRAMDRRIAPYRQAARTTAITTGARFLDPAQAFAGCHDCVLLQHDAIHLTPLAHELLGEWLVRHIRPQAIESTDIDRSIRQSRAFLENNISSMNTP